MLWKSLKAILVKAAPMVIVVTLAMVPVRQTTMAPAAADQVVMVWIPAEVAPILIALVTTVLMSEEIIVELGVMACMHTLALIALSSFDIPCVKAPLCILYGGKFSRGSVSQIDNLCH